MEDGGEKILLGVKAICLMVSIPVGIVAMELAFNAHNDSLLLVDLVGIVAGPPVVFLSARKLLRQYIALKGRENEDQ